MGQDIAFTPDDYSGGSALQQLAQLFGLGSNGSSTSDAGGFYTGNAAPNPPPVQAQPLGAMNGLQPPMGGQQPPQTGAGSPQPSALQQLAQIIGQPSTPSTPNQPTRPDTSPSFGRMLLQAIAPNHVAMYDQLNAAAQNRNLAEDAPTMQPQAVLNQAAAINGNPQEIAGRQIDMQAFAPLAGDPSLPPLVRASVMAAVQRGDSGMAMKIMQSVPDMQAKYQEIAKNKAQTLETQVNTARNAGVNAAGLNAIFNGGASQPSQGMPAPQGGQPMPPPNAGGASGNPSPQQLATGTAAALPPLPAGALGLPGGMAGQGGGGQLRGGLPMPSPPTQSNTGEPIAAQNSPQDSTPGARPPMPNQNANQQADMAQPETTQKFIQQKNEALQKLQQIPLTKNAEDTADARTAFNTAMSGADSYLNQYHQIKQLIPHALVGAAYYDDDGVTLNPAGKALLMTMPQDVKDATAQMQKLAGQSVLSQIKEQLKSGDSKGNNRYSQQLVSRSSGLNLGQSAGAVLADADTDAKLFARTLLTSHNQVKYNGAETPNWSPAAIKIAQESGENLPPEVLRQGIAQGVSPSVKVLSPDGKAFKIDASEINDAVKNGWKVVQ